MSDKVRYLSVFSGIEAASMAWEPLGWEPIAFAEVDEFPSAVLAHRYPNVPNLGDVCKIDWGKVVEEFGRPDVLVGGSPCQSFSVAAGANRTSLDGKSNLMFEYLRAVDEVRPEWLVWENVPGVLRTRDNAFVQLIGTLQDLGYVSIAWRVLDAQFFGVAQRRRRVFLVANLGCGGGATAVLFEQDSVRGNTTTSKKQREELARAARDGADSGCSGIAVTSNYGKDIAGTLTARYDSSACADRGQNVICMASGQANAEIELDGVSPTLTLLHEAPIVCHEQSAPHTTTPPTIVIDRAAYNQGKNASYAPHIEETDVMDPLIARGPHAVGYDGSGIRIRDGS